MKSTPVWLRPGLQHIQIKNSRAIQISNKLKRGLRAQHFSKIIALGQEVHREIRSGSDKSMHEYTRSRGSDAALKFNELARDRFPSLTGLDVIRGIQVPGSIGMFGGMVGLHHLSALYFKDMHVGVDTTIAQLREPNGHFKNTEVLLIIAEAEDQPFTNALIETYGGGLWGIAQED